MLKVRLNNSDMHMMHGGGEGGSDAWYIYAQRSCSISSYSIVTYAFVCVCVCGRGGGGNTSLK